MFYNRKPNRHKIADKPNGAKLTALCTEPDFAVVVELEVELELLPEEELPVEDDEDVEEEAVVVPAVTLDTESAEYS